MKSVAVIVVSTLLLVSTIISAAPSPYNQDYDVSEVKEVYEILKQRDLLDSLNNLAINPYQHRLVRKNQRSPSLRLRFGRRSDPALYQNALNAEYHNDSDVN